jgi:RimJ/RimL family protein N-acetyltransferase
MNQHAKQAVFNEYSQPIGPALPGWKPSMSPQPCTLQGRYCRLEGLDPQRHREDLSAAYSIASDGRDWTYLFAEPFTDAAGLAVYLAAEAARVDRVSFAIMDEASGRALGIFALLRIDAPNSVIEMGNVNFSPALKRTRIATEAHYLMMCHVFGTLGYRRYEWKCDSLNAPSRAAAERLGFCFEGIFRQAVVYKGRSRDTAWFSILDGEWPGLRSAFETWLAPENFDRQGRQKQALADLRRAL